MLLHDNCVTLFVNLQAVVLFHSREKCASCIVCFECISVMADNDKTLIGDGNFSTKNRNPNVPTIFPTSSGNINTDTLAPHHVTVSEPSTLKRKQTSFQITSVTVQGSRLSTDGGEDSADDLDESHTEDASSDILDCSRTTDADNDQLSEDNSNANNDEISVATPSIPVKCRTEIHAKHDTAEAAKIPSESSTPPVEKISIMDEPKETGPTVNPPTLPDQWQHRFRVVKIVSSEPFKRGRWLCMDFVDPPAPAVEAKPEVAEATPNSSAQGTPGASLHDASIPADRVAHIYEISPNDAYPGTISVAVGPDQMQQPMYGIFLPIHSSQYPLMSGINARTVPVTLQQDVKIQESTRQSPVAQEMQPQQQQSQPQPPPAVAPPPPQQPPPPSQQQQSFPTSQVVPPASTVSQSVQPAPPQSTVTVPVSVPAPQPPPTTAPPVAQPPSTEPPVRAQPSIAPQPVTATVVTSSSQQQQPPPSEAVPLGTPPPNVHQFQPVPPATTTSGAAGFTSSVGTQASAVPNIPEGSSTSTVKAPETVSVPSQAVQNHVETKELSTPPSTNSQISQEVLPESAPPKSDMNGEDSESIPSGTSTVAIDNKIEQAMDLVKSHLMFAVREEVDVLKEKITELMDRISQLEYENGFLRANASQQTLEQLNQSQLLQQQQQQSQPSSVAVNSIPPVTQLQPVVNIQNQQSTS